MSTPSVRTEHLKPRTMRDRFGLLLPFGDTELPAFRALTQVDRTALVRFGVFVIILCTALFYAPSLVGGYMADDHLHVLMLREYKEMFTGRFNLFGMIKSAEEIALHKRFGLAPWWTSPEMRINFFRPIPSITHWLDYRLFPGNAAFAHLVNIGWYLGAVYLVYRLLARFLGESSRVLLLAVAIFAFDDAHALNVTWIANRNESIAGIFVLLALLAWFRLREGKGRYHAPLVALAFLGGLLSKESTVVLPLLVLTHALVIPEREGTTLWQRAKERLSLHIVLFALAGTYLVLYFAAGHGANSAYYVNPFRNPGLWATQFFRSGFFHAVILATGVPLHVLSSSPVRDYPWAAAGLGFLTVGFWIIAWRWLREDRPFRLAILWMIIGQAILTTSFPDPRNLFLPSIAFAYVVARVIQEAWNRRRTYAPARPIVVWLVGLHLVFAPVLCQVCIAVVNSFQGRYHTLSESLKTAVDYDHLGPEETQVFFLNWQQREMSALYGLYLRSELGTGVSDYSRWTEDKKLPYVEKLRGGLGAERIHYYTLSLLQGEVNLEVVDENTIVVSPKRGHYFSTVFELLFTTGERYRAGQTFDNSVFRATIEAVTADNEVTRVRFTFPERLDSPRYRFMYFDGERFAVAHFASGKLSLASK